MSVFGAYRPIRQIDHGHRSDVRYIVLHTIENESLEAAEQWFKDPRAKGVGAHFGVGRFGRVVQWAGTYRLVYHAKGGNTYGVGIENAGKASYSRARWLARIRQRRALAKLIAGLCHVHKLGEPRRAVVKLHTDFPEGHHGDPGPGFPVERTISLARYYYHKR